MDRCGDSWETGRRWGVILLAHGSRSRWGEETPRGMAEMARRLQGRLSDGARVAVAYLEALSPSLPEAVAHLAGDGASLLVVLPYLLGEGRHAREAEALARAVQERFPGLRVKVGKGLGGHPRLADLVAERVREALDGRGPGPWGLVLVKAGTRFPHDPLDWLRSLGEAVRDRLGEEVRVAPARASYAPPTVEEAGEALVQKGVRGLIVLPCLFFPGKVLARDIGPAVERLRGRWPGLPIALARPLGVDDRLVEALHDRLSCALEEG